MNNNTLSATVPTTLAPQGLIKRIAETSTVRVAGRVMTVSSNQAYMSQLGSFSIGNYRTNGEAVWSFEHCAVISNPPAPREQCDLELDLGEPFIYQSYPVGGIYSFQRVRGGDVRLVCHEGTPVS